MNAALADRLGGLAASMTHDNFTVHFGETDRDANAIRHRIDELRGTDPADMVSPLDDVKFMQCVPLEFVSRPIEACFTRRQAWQALRDRRMVLVRR